MLRIRFVRIYFSLCSWIEIVHAAFQKFARDFLVFHTEVGSVVSGYADFVDDQVPTLARMYQKKLKGYQAMGYSNAEGDEITLNRGRYLEAHRREREAAKRIVQTHRFY